jgi:putative nucleotidyltransferase with HDIG domain
MKIKHTFLKSKVGRRIFALFVLCALLPITVLAVVSFTHVTEQLEEQSKKRLHLTVKAVGLEIMERLILLEAELEIVAFNLSRGLAAVAENSDSGSQEILGPRFEGLALISPTGKHTPIVGQVEDPPSASEAEWEHMGSGKSVLITRTVPSLSAEIFIYRVVDSKESGRQLLAGHINSRYFWGTSERELRPPMTELCILDQDGKLLFSSFPSVVSFPEEAERDMRRSSTGQFGWHQGGEEYIARYWSVFLKYMFHTPQWTVVLSESRADVLAPMARFKKIFPLIVLLALWVVVFLSIAQIRRNLVPLERLQEGTQRIARREFDTVVTVTSGDEFEELAESFNAMAYQLGRQFNAMATMNEIDRAVLSALDTRKIVDTVLTRMRELHSCDSVGIALFGSDSPDAGLMNVLYHDLQTDSWLEPIKLNIVEAQELQDNHEYLQIDATRGYPSYLTTLAEKGAKAFLVLPMFLSGRLSGFIVMGYHDPAACEKDDRVQARQLADQVTVALNNARLLEQLEELNWGTLYALARAIDAKSPWTAGHSERVTRMALKIGRMMRLGKRELENIHRGGLLHDIGKLGTPPEILDKPGRLSEEEIKLMNEHVLVGARILEPIAAYADVLPIVLQHHECYDGTGYPEGISGEDIDLKARIFSVADVYDALSTDRPYRKALPLDEVVDYIKQGSGTRYDPKVVDAFIKVMEEQVKKLLQASPAAEMHAG